MQSVVEFKAIQRLPMRKKSRKKKNFKKASKKRGKLNTIIMNFGGSSKKLVLFILKCPILNLVMYLSLFYVESYFNFYL